MRKNVFFGLFAGIVLVLAGCPSGGGDSEQTYAVSIGTVTRGAITADPASGFEGDEITLTVTPDTGYQLKPGTLQYVTPNGAETLINETTKKFNLPAADVTVTAEFEAAVPENYTVTIGNLINPNGSTITASPVSGPQGTEITLTFSYGNDTTLKKGTLQYETTDGTITAIDETTKKFNLPASNVTVTAEFETAFPNNPNARLIGTVWKTTMTEDVNGVEETYVITLAFGEETVRVTDTSSDPGVFVWEYLVAGDSVDITVLDEDLPGMGGTKTSTLFDENNLTINLGMEEQTFIKQPAAKDISWEGTWQREDDNTRQWIFSGNNSFEETDAGTMMYIGTWTIDTDTDTLTIDVTSSAEEEPSPGDIIIMGYLFEDEDTLTVTMTGRSPGRTYTRQ